MPMPEFTDDEQFLINAMRGNGKLVDASQFMWTSLIASAVIAGFAAFYGNIWMMFSAFIVLSATRVYEEWWQARYKPLLRSLILKYEAAIAGAPENQISN